MACKEVQDLRRDYRKHLRNTEKCKNQLQGLMQKQAKQNEIDRYNNYYRYNYVCTYCVIIDKYMYNNYVL